MGKFTDYKNQYNRENYDRLSIALPKGYKEKLKNHADSQNLSITALIVKLLDEDMKKRGE